MLRLYYEALEGFRRRSAWCVALAVVSGLTEALGIASVLPLLTGALDDRSDLGREYFGLRGDDLAVAALIALVVLGLVAAVLRYLADIAALRVRVDVEESMRSRITEVLFHMDWPSYLHLSLGDTGKSVIIEANQAGAGVQNIINGLGYLAIAGVFVVIAALISPIMTLATLVFGAAIAVVYRVAGKRAEASSRQLSEEAAELTETTTDLFGNSKFYRSSGLRRVALKRANSGFAAWKRMNMRVERFAPATRLIFDASGLVFITGVLALAVLVSNDSPLEPLVFLALFYRLAPKLQQAQQGLLGARTQGSWWRTWRERFDDASLHAEHTSGSVVPDASPLIELVDVSYSFPGQERAVLDAVSWELEPGRCLALVGESGSGKTTALDLVTGLLRPTKGTVRLNGTDLLDVDLEAWRNHIGFVMQDAPMFFGTVLENIAWDGETPDRERAERAATLAHLDDVISSLPNGLETRVGHRGARLSGGQRQRVALARALYREPWLLVLDEATSALDSESEQQIRDALNSLRGKVSMLIVAHRLHTVEIADRILVLAGGQVVEQGTWAELNGGDGAFRRMAAAQGISRPRAARAGA